MNEPWYQNAVFYAIDVESFQDGNGDGVGDFAGLSSRLDYLEELGVTCLWLLPFYPTPNRDNGYDVRDYYGVDPRLGTLQDFADFVAAARQRGLRVLVDLIIHHTSDEHPWFQAACADAASRFRQYYVWRPDEPATETPQLNNFPDEENGVWSYAKRAGAFYHHRFYCFQPDLNMANPAVQREVHAIMEFWLAFGIDGFRVDAATHLLDDKGLPGTRLPRPAQFLGQLRRTVARRHPKAVLLAEADVSPARLGTYFGRGERLHLLFDFRLASRFFLALARGQAAPLAESLREPRPPRGCQWAVFLRNLDQLDLDQLSPAEQEEVLAAFAPEPEMRIHGRGIRRRLAPLLGGDRRRLELAYSLLFGLPGAPVLVYGDEIGQGDNLRLPGRTSVRTHMQWTDGPTAGFSTAPPPVAVHAPAATGPFSPRRVNVARQRADETSLLCWLQRLLRLRLHCPEIGAAPPQVLATDQPQVLAHAYAHDGRALVLLHNLADQPCAVRLRGRRYYPRQLTDLLADSAYAPTTETSRTLELQPYGYRWLRVAQPGLP